MDVQEKINNLAKEYFYAAKNNNPAQKMSKRNEILSILWENNDVSRKLISKVEKFNKYFQYLGIYENGEEDEKKHDYNSDPKKDDIKSMIFEIFINEIDKYDYEKNNNFTAWFINTVYYNVSNKVKKFQTTKDAEIDKQTGKKIPRPIATLQNSIKDEDDNEVDIYETMPDKDDDYKKIDQEKNLNEVRNKLLTVCTLFYQRKKGKGANETKYSYYRIFLTESIVNDIRNEDKTDMYNGQEVMQIIDDSYVRFVAFTDLKELKDILFMRMKRYSEVLNNGDDRVIKLNHEPRIIIEYRYVSGIDEKRVKEANVSQQYKAYLQDLEEIGISK